MHEIWQEPQPMQRMHHHLCWLGLLLTVHIRHKQDVNECKVGIANMELKLPHRLHKWCRLNITHGPPQLDDTHIWLLICLIHWDLGDVLDPVLYGTSDVWNDLHSFSEVGSV